MKTLRKLFVVFIVVLVIGSGLLGTVLVVWDLVSDPDPEEHTCITATVLIYSDLMGKVLEVGEQMLCGVDLHYSIAVGPTMEDFLDGGGQLEFYAKESD